METKALPKTLVLEPDILIATDISEIVRKLLPRAEIIVCKSVRDATTTLHCEATWDVVIANHRMLQGPYNALQNILDRSAGLKILLDPRAVAEAAVSQGWLSVPFPFSEDTISDALGTLQEELEGNH